MAKIWAVYEGWEPTRGDSWADLPVSKAIELFELQSDDWIADLATIPRFGASDRDLWYLAHKHVVVEIGSSEGRRAKWKPGFYRSGITPEEAFRRLVEEPLVAELGAENVVRAECEPATDSRGRDALKITVVITPGAMAKLTNGAPLAARVRLQDRLGEMGDDRTAIIHYATEAELAQDASA